MQLWKLARLKFIGLASSLEIPVGVDVGCNLESKGRLEAQFPPLQETSVFPLRPSLTG